MRRLDPWDLLFWLAIVMGLALGFLARDPVPDHPTVQELAARFAAQEEYYRVADLYGDLVGATEVARLVYEEATQ